MSKKYRAVCGDSSFFPSYCGDREYENDLPDATKLRWVDNIAEADRMGKRYCNEYNSQQIYPNMAMSYYIEDEEGDECELPQKYKKANSAVNYGIFQKEQVFIVDRISGIYIIKGAIEREFAENNQIRHLTTICVAFIMDGEHREKWIVHNRRHKQIAKGLESPEYSYNLFGGHCSTDGYALAPLLDVRINDDFLRRQMVRELNEEIMEIEDGDRHWPRVLEIWEDDKQKMMSDYPQTVTVSPYRFDDKDLIPIGFTEYSGHKNSEYSFVFALPILSGNYPRLIAADDYYLDGDHSKHNIALPVSVFSERELKRMMRFKKRKVEICDSITRLFEKENSPVLEKLRAEIKRCCYKGCE